LQKSQKMESQTSPGHLNDLQNIGAKVGHHETSALNKIQNIVLMKKKKKEKK